MNREQLDYLLLSSETLYPCVYNRAGAVAALTSEFAARGVKVFGLSVDATEDHARWMKGIQEVSGYSVDFRMIGDPELHIRKRYDMLPADAGNTSLGRTPALNAPARSIFVIGPEKRIKLMMAYPMTIGRNFNEILRGLHSMQLTAHHKVATPATWKSGDRFTAAISDDDAKTILREYTTVTPYLRYTKQPH